MAAWRWCAAADSGAGRREEVVDGEGRRCVSRRNEKKKPREKGEI